MNWQNIMKKIMSNKKPLLLVLLILVVNNCQLNAMDGSKNHKLINKKYECQTQIKDGTEILEYSSSFNSKSNYFDLELFNFSLYSDINKENSNNNEKCDNEKIQKCNTNLNINNNFDNVFINSIEKIKCNNSEEMQADDSELNSNEQIIINGKYTQYADDIDCNSETFDVTDIFNNQDTRNNTIQNNNTYKLKSNNKKTKIKYGARHISKNNVFVPEIKVNRNNCYSSIPFSTIPEETNSENDDSNKHLIRESQEEVNNSSDYAEEESFSEKDSSSQEEKNERKDSTYNNPSEKDSNLPEEINDYEYFLKDYSNYGKSNIVDMSKQKEITSNNISNTNNNIKKLILPKNNPLMNFSNNNPSTNMKQQLFEEQAGETLILPKNNPLTNLAKKSSENQYISPEDELDIKKNGYKKYMENQFKNSILINFYNNNKKYNSVNNEKQSNLVISKEQPYDTQIVLIAKNISKQNQAKRLANQFIDLLFTQHNNNTIEYNNDFLNNILEYSFSEANVYLLDEIRYILSNEFVQSELNENFKCKTVKNLNTVIKLLNAVSQIGNEKISKKVQEIISLSLFSFNSFKEMYNTIYNNKTDKAKLQDAVNEFLKLVNNPLLLEIYFTTHNDIGKESLCFCKILSNRYQDKTLSNAINMIKDNLVNVLLDLDTSNNKNLDNIKRNILDVLLR